MLSAPPARSIYFYNFNDLTVLLPYVLRGCFSLSCNLSDLDSFTSIFLFLSFWIFPEKECVRAQRKPCNNFLLGLVSITCWAVSFPRRHWSFYTIHTTHSSMQCCAILCNILLLYTLTLHNISFTLTTTLCAMNDI